MDHFRELISLDRAAELPLYLQVSNAIMLQIRLGRLRKGLKLPGTRAMATVLNINRMTVVAAFEELQAQGWIEMVPQKGTFIKTILPILTPKTLGENTAFFELPEHTGFGYDDKRILPVSITDFPASDKLVFNDGFPDLRITPIADLIKSMRRMAGISAYKKYLMYGNPQGTTFLRETLASFLSDTRGLPIAPENVLVTRGAQMGLFLAASIVLKRGDAVVLGTPGYMAAQSCLLQLGARVHAVPVDGAGLNIDAVEQLCKKKKIKMVFVIPHHHNPTTVTLSHERRIQLLALANRYKFAIIEDDYDYDFHYASKPLMPMASLDRYGNVIYIGTLTKTLAPAIRFGFIVAPAAFISTATSLRKTIDRQGDSLMENAIATLYKDGSIARHIKKSVKLYKERRDHLCDLLQTELGNKISFKIPDGGMSVWTRFLDNDLSLLSPKALAKGLVIGSGMEYDTKKIKYNAVRLGFAALNFNEQDKAIDILRKLMQ